MKYKIKHLNGETMFSLKTTSIKLCVEAAVKAGVNLSHADLSHANLLNADLFGADLTGAGLFGADLTGANLSGANLSHANLLNADLSHTNLLNADLTGANLSCANLYGANLFCANLANANLNDLQKARLSILPDCGDVIGWKKCKNGVIVKLRIPEDSPRSNAVGRKCRAAFADVLDVIGAHVGYSKLPSGGEKLVYEAGKRVTCVKPFDENRWNECASGIHFYLTRIEAEND